MAKREPTPGVVLEKTIIIWDELNADVIFFLVEGDKSHLNRVYINTYYDDSVEQNLTEDQFNERMNELNDLIYGEDGLFLNAEMTEFPAEAVKQGARVIVAGFLTNAPHVRDGNDER